MKRYSVSGRGLAAVEVPASNWIMALGAGLERMGQAADVERLACEVLPNGTVIARDVETGQGYVVQAVIEAEDVDDPTTLQSAEMKEIDELGIKLVEIGDASSVTFACQLALEAAQEVVDVESGSVILVQDEHLRFMAAVGPLAPRLVGVRLPLGTGVAGFSMEKRQIVVLGDAARDERHWGEMDRLTGYETRQMACVPIVRGEQVYGVIEVLNLPTGRRFAREQIQRLQRVSRALAARLERDAPTA